jgi:2-keto-4-pentenoate hydratase/2-oxohepta-3-ene-1,7-dioic acid hydratase in catechol pathway
VRLVSYLTSGEPRLGILWNEAVHDVAKLGHGLGKTFPSSMIELIDGGQDLLRAVDKGFAACDEAAKALISRSLSDVELLAPIPRPRKNIFGVGLNYASHVDEASRSLDTSKDIPTEPVYFTKAPTAVVAPGKPILLHSDVTKQLDWEAELAVVIGRGGKRIAAKDALSHVFGYSCLIDVSARDCRRAGQWFLAKGQDGSAPFGPALVTLDEITNPHSLDISLTVNGVLKQSSNTRHMIFRIEQLIADLSRAITLEPGDIIATGTPSGVGISFTPPQFLQPGDLVEMEIQGIGRLSHPVEEA